MTRKRAVAVMNVALASVTFSALAWWSLVSPAAFNHVPLLLVNVLNVPPALVGLLYGRGTNGSLLSAVMRSCDFCSPREHMLSYFAAAIPAYVLLFTTIAYVVARMKMRQHRTT